jgi:putative transposase
VSRLNHTLTQQFEAWRERPLQGHWRILYLDGVYFTARHGERTDSTVLLTALGVDLEGNKEVLALRACADRSVKMAGVACSKIYVSVGRRRSI